MVRVERRAIAPYEPPDRSQSAVVPIIVPLARQSPPHDTGVRRRSAGRVMDRARRFSGQRRVDLPLPTSCQRALTIRGPSLPVSGPLGPAAAATYPPN